MDNIAMMILTDPESLLPVHQYLLDTDFEKLGERDTIERWYWLASMSSAPKAAQMITMSANNHNTVDDTANTS
jgi:hypothetical protein